MLFSVSLGFFFRVEFRVTTNRLPQSEDVSLSIWVMVRVTNTQLPASEDRKIDLREVG